MRNPDWKRTLIHATLLISQPSSCFVQPTLYRIVFILLEPQIDFTWIFWTKLYLRLRKSITHRYFLGRVYQSKLHGVLVEPDVDIEFLLGFNNDYLREEALIIEGSVNQSFEHSIYPDGSDCGFCLSSDRLFQTLYRSIFTLTLAWTTDPKSEG